MKRRLLLIALIWITLLSGCDSAQIVGNNSVVFPSDEGVIISPTPSLEEAPSIPTLTFTSAPPTQEPAIATDIPTFEPEPVTPPGIILFIGDGMGANHRKAATWLASGQSGTLMMDSLPVHGSVQTLNVNNAITDSGAAATAIATGFLTNNYVIGVDREGNAVSTILELAQANGWSVGLVTTTSLVHATPAAFAAHVPDRDNRTEIARQMMAHNVDVLLGGGEDDFFSSDESGCFNGNGKQPPDVKLIADAIAAGYTYICRPEELQELDLSDLDRLIGLFGADSIRRPISPSLVEMTETALTILARDPDGFFLMVEAGQVDWAAHGNQAKNVIPLTLGLNAAVARAQVFILDRPNTLLIVTADHETGGMSVNLDGEGSSTQDGPFAMPDGTTFWVNWSTGYHTSERVPVTAQGPYADMLAGEIHLTQIFEAMYTYMVYRGIE